MLLRVPFFILVFLTITIYPGISFSDTAADVEKIRDLLDRECINLKKDRMLNLLTSGFSPEIQKGLDPELLNIMEGVIKRTDFDGISEDRTSEIIGLVYGAFKKGAPLEYLDEIFDVTYSQDVSPDQLYAAANALKEFYNSDVPRDIYEEFVYHSLEGKWDAAAMPVLTRGLIYGVDRGLTAQKVALSILIDVDQGGLKRKSADDLVLEAIKSVREKEPEKWKPMGEVERNLMMKLVKKRDLDKLRQDTEAKKSQKEMEKQKAEKNLKRIEEEKNRLSDEEKRIAMELSEIEKRNQDALSRYEREQEDMRKREEEERQKFEQERQRLLMLQQEAERKRQEAEVLRYRREQEEMRKAVEEENRRLKAEKERIAREREEIKRKNLEIVKKYMEDQDAVRERKEREENIYAKEQERIAKDIEKMLKAYQNELAKYQKEQSDADTALEMQMKEAEREKERRNREREEKRRKELAAMEQRAVEYGRRGDLDVNRLFSSIDRYIGIPYRFGGDSTNGIDCSAFTRRLYREQGVELPRTSREQAMVGMDTGNLLIPGDLIFFNTSMTGTISHVGVYMDNNTFAHASSSQGVTKSSIRERYYSKRYVRANRIFE